MAITPESIQEIEAKLFEILTNAPAGFTAIKLSTEWFLYSPGGYTIGASLAEAITKADHRGLFE